MEISLNNRNTRFEADSMTISEIMEAKSFIFKMLVVKLNGNLIQKSQYASTQVKEGDRLDIIHLVSGG